MASTTSDTPSSTASPSTPRRTQRIELSRRRFAS
jgi:hypothetical protein